jgi:hypothetical protein
MSQKTYHGDASRGHNFWVYPRNQGLGNPESDTYAATDLCDNLYMYNSKTSLEF